MAPRRSSRLPAGPRQPPPPPAGQIDHGALWRVASFEHHQRVGPRAPYWYDNRGRRPAGDCAFQYTLAGAMVLERDGVDHPVPMHHAALYRYSENSAYGLRPDAIQHYEARWAVFRGAGLEDHWAALQRSGGSVIPCEPDSALMGRFDEVLAAGSDAGDPLAVAAAVQEFVLALYAHLRRSRLRRLGPAAQAVERILAMPHHPWSLKELAREHGCSREHLLRSFRARTGEPPASWLRRMRLARAEDLLRDTDLPVADVARQSGFTSTHTRARLIRHHHGCAPTDLRHRR